MIHLRGFLRLKRKRGSLSVGYNCIVKTRRARDALVIANALREAILSRMMRARVALRAFATSASFEENFFAKSVEGCELADATRAYAGFRWSMARAIMSIIAQIRGRYDLKFSASLPIHPINLVSVTSLQLSRHAFPQTRENVAL